MRILPFRASTPTPHTPMWSSECTPSLLARRWFAWPSGVVELTRERKVLLGVLAVAGAAMFLDRAVLGGGPQQASASVSDAAAAARPAPGTAVGGESPASIRARLQQAASADQVDSPDAFRTPSKWLKVPAGASAPASQSPADPVLTGVARLRLTGIISGDPARAVIDGTLLQVGDEIGGLVVQAIDPDNRVVTIQSGGQTFTLNLDIPSGTGR